eukprot:1505055-Pleurochrysis_carterae.AAC.1
MPLRAEGRAWAEWLELLETASAMLDENEGVPLAPREVFAQVDDAGVITTTTDASGVDGVGGYAFEADEPGRVWIVSEKWPAD